MAFGGPVDSLEHLNWAELSQKPLLIIEAQLKKLFFRQDELFFVLDERQEKFAEHKLCVAEFSGMARQLRVTDCVVWLTD